MQISVVLVLCAVAVSTIVEAKSAFPPYITVCTRSNLEECVLKNAEAIRPHLGNGIARLAIPPTSPNIVPQIKVSNGDLFSMEANNIITKDIGGFQLKHFNLDFDKNTLELEVNFPTLEPVGDYVMKGSVLGIALDTAGKGLGTFKNVNIKAKLTGELVKKEGKEYLHFTDKEFEVTDIEDAYIYLYSLSSTTNQLINTQTKMFLKGMGPVMETYVGAIVEGCTRFIFEKYPLEELFPK